MANENDKKIFDQLLGYYRDIGEDSSPSDEELSDSDEREFNRKFPLLKELDIFYDWKGLYIHLSNDPRGQYTGWMLPTVFGARSERLTQERHEFELFYFGKIFR